MEGIGALRVVPLEGQRFLCFCSGGSGSLQFHVTNACEFWSCDVTSDKCGGHSSQDGLASSDDWICQLKDAWESQTPSLTVRDSRATLKFQNGRESLTFDLHKAPLSEARKQVQELLFGLVVQVQKLEKRLEEGAVSPTAPSPLSSPKKDTLMGRSLFIPELSSTRGRAGSSTGQVASKRRLPGESLINPGFINKKTPTGVDFEDA